MSATPEVATPSNLAVAGWIFGSIASSVGIILVNKQIFAFGFKYVFTLTSLHFLVTAMGMEVMACLRIFERARMPFRDAAIMALMCIGSVGFMNFSLDTNSVGFYQVCKLMCIPVMVAIQSRFYGQSQSKKIKAVLVVVIAGVGVATVTDVQLNSTGMIFGALAVVFTAQFQIMQGDKQKQHRMNAMQINHSQALPSFFVCLILALMFESHGEDTKKNVLLHTRTAELDAYIFVSCVLALSVNLCTYGLIGKTSPVTYQVVGHAKTCLVLLGGYIIFPVGADTQQFMKNVAGVGVAMFGVILYGHIKMIESMSPRPADWCDRSLPEGILRWLDPTAGYTAVSQKATELETVTTHTTEQAQTQTQAQVQTGTSNTQK